MKDIILPITTDTAVDLAVINEDTKGLIIVYNDKSPIGYISYGEQCWFFYNNINGINYKHSEFNLVDLVNKLLANNKSISFKLLEFE